MQTKVQLNYMLEINADEFRLISKALQNKLTQDDLQPANNLQNKMIQDRRKQMDSLHKTFEKERDE